MPNSLAGIFGVTVQEIVLILPAYLIASASVKASLACVPTRYGDFCTDLTRIDVPTLVIHSDEDRIVPIAAAGHRMAKLIKGARQLVVKGGPHCITWTDAQEVNAELLSFLGEKGVVAA